MGRPKRGAAAKAEDAKEDTKKVKAGLGVGDQLPEFELETDEEKTLSSADLVKDNGIILFCYPKANTKGCTSQAVGLSEKSKELAEAGYKVYGISADKPTSQANWKKKEEGITCTLLCDPSQEVLGQLGFLKGKKINRSHLVVAKGGQVLDVQYGITPKNSIKDAVEFCLEHKGEPAAAEKAEEAAAAGDEAEAKSEQQEGPKEEAGAEAEAEGADKQAGDKAEEPAAAEEEKQEEEKKDEATPMETDAAPADEAPAAEQQQDKPAEEAPAAAEEAPAAAEEQDAEPKAAESTDEVKAGDDEAPAAAAEEAAPDAAAPEQPAEEAAAPEEPAAPEQPAADEPAPPAAADEPAPAAAAAEEPAA